MSRFVPSSIKLTTEHLTLMESVSRRQGELSTGKRNIRDEISMESVAAIDAVHFSTKIEGNTLSRDQVTDALGPKRRKGGNRDLQEVLNYARARKLTREWALKARPFTEEWLLAHHTEVLKGIVTSRLRGHYRQDQCVIRDSGSKAIVYMAPEWRDVPTLTRELLIWLRAQKKEGASSLLLAAQFHFELVTIHPFMDGNGRIARLLTNGILLAGGYDVERYAALEKQHERSRSDYYRALRNLQASNYYDIPPGRDIGSWISYWLRCLLATYDEALERVTGARASILDDSLDSRLRKAESLFKRHGKLRASEYADLMNLGRTQAVADLNALISARFIVKVGGGRSTVYRLKS